MSPGDGKVADGVRYHVLDVWVGWVGRGLMRPVERLGREGRTKVVRERARDVLGDERLEGGDTEGDIGGNGEDEEFEGFGE